VAAMLFVAVFVVGCASGAETVPLGGKDSGNPYAVEFREAMKMADSEFIVSILEDYEITDAEFGEAQDKMIACLEESGAKAVLSDDNGIRKVSGTTPDSRCWDEWVGDIDVMYRSIKLNPNNENWSDLVAACFIRIGVVPDGFTGKDLEELEDKASDHSDDTGIVTEDDLDEEGNFRFDPEKWISAENPDPVLPTGVKLYSAETETCRNNPLSVGID
jgi:hypothetical protein